MPRQDTQLGELLLWSRLQRLTLCPGVGGRFHPRCNTDTLRTGCLWNKLISRLWKTYPFLLDAERMLGGFRDKSLFYKILPICTIKWWNEEKEQWKRWPKYSPPTLRPCWSRVGVCVNQCSLNKEQLGNIQQNNFKITYLSKDWNTT